MIVVLVLYSVCISRGVGCILIPSNTRFSLLFSEFLRGFVWACVWNRCTSERCREQKDSWAENRRWESGETLSVLRWRVCVWQGKPSALKAPGGDAHMRQGVFLLSLYSLMRSQQKTESILESSFFTQPILKFSLWCVFKIYTLL